MSLTSFASLEINKENRTSIITDKEYSCLKIDGNFLTKLRLANISDTQTLGRYGNKEYSFDMSSSNTGYHDGFTTRISNVSCTKGVLFEVIIEENTREIYRATFDRAVTLKTEARRNSKYRVTIKNEKSANLNFDIDINSYIR